MSGETCATCRFYGRTHKAEAGGISSRGGCRRRSPIGSGLGNWTWPPVEAEDWCGDYERKPTVREAGL